MLSKINKLEPRQVAYLFAILGIIVFFTGLNGAFQGDDGYQIVNNIPVHSLSHIVQLFKSGTFYNGQHLTGIYYRPMMSVVFAFIYTLFGAHPIAFHIVQLSLYVSGVFILYLIFRRYIKQSLALFLALLFLVLPINSQAVFAIPSMQDVLFFFFGLLGLWTVMTYKSIKGLWLCALCFFLSMLSKETAVIFILMAMLYLFLFEKKRIYKFAAVMVVPVALYLALKINAVGLNAKQNGAPIDNLHIFGRLMNDPSIIFFYVTKSIFPWKLATGYYWTYPKFSVGHFVLPLIIDLAVVGIFVYFGLRIRRKLSQTQYYAYLFFAVLSVISVLPYLQVVPLDMTFCEDWFLPSLAGVLGMIGIALTTIKLRVDTVWFVWLGILLIGIFGIRTAIRGTDYQSQYKLAVHDISVSKEDYSAMNDIADGLTSQGKFKEAEIYAQQSINIYPVVSNYNNLGVALQGAGDYTQASKAYNTALLHGSLSIIYENLGQIELAYGTPPSNFQFFQKALNAYPQDYKLWLYLAILEGVNKNNTAAKTAIKNSAKYGPLPAVIYNDIINGKPFTLPLLGKLLLVQ